MTTRDDNRLFIRTLFILQNGSASTRVKAGINPCVANFNLRKETFGVIETN